MEILSIDTPVQQLSYGYKLLLPFTDHRNNTLVPVDDGDTWKVFIVKPDGTQLEKTASLEFPDVDVAEIAVPIVDGDLNQRGDYRYEVIRTTGGALVRSEPRTFTVLSSLPA